MRTPAQSGKTVCGGRTATEETVQIRVTLRDTIAVSLRAGLRAYERLTPSESPSHLPLTGFALVVGQWRNDSPQLAYRCGGSAGIVAHLDRYETHRLPVSSLGRTPSGHLKRDNNIPHSLAAAQVAIASVRRAD